MITPNLKPSLLHLQANASLMRPRRKPTGFSACREKGPDQNQICSVLAKWRSTAVCDLMEEGARRCLASQISSRLKYLNMSGTTANDETRLLGKPGPYLFVLCDVVEQGPKLLLR